MCFRGGVLHEQRVGGSLALVGAGALLPPLGVCQGACLQHPILGAQLLPHPARAPIVLRYWFLGAIPSWQDNCRNERPLLFCGWPRVTLLTNWWLLCVLLFVTWVICRNSLHHEQRGGKPKAARGWTQTNMGMLAL
jgi:hypothetical protein